MGGAYSQGWCKCGVYGQQLAVSRRGATLHRAGAAAGRQARPHLCCWRGAGLALQLGLWVVPLGAEQQGTADGGREPAVGQGLPHRGPAAVVAGWGVGAWLAGHSKRACGGCARVCNIPDASGSREAGGRASRSAAARLASLPPAPPSAHLPPSRTMTNLNSNSSPAGTSSLAVHRLPSAQARLCAAATSQPPSDAWLPHTQSRSPKDTCARKARHSWVQCAAGEANGCSSCCLPWMLRSPHPAPSSVQLRGCRVRAPAQLAVLQPVRAPGLLAVLQPHPTYALTLCWTWKHTSTVPGASARPLPAATITPRRARACGPGAPRRAGAGRSAQCTRTGRERT